MNQTDASEGAESIYRNGKVYTGYYKKFHALSQADQDKVMAERERQGIKRRVLRRKQVVKSCLPRLLRKNLPLLNVN